MIMTNKTDGESAREDILYEPGQCASQGVHEKSAGKGVFFMFMIYSNASSVVDFTSTNTRLV